jgi:NAD(P)-dependent dehydrogenase (short-subunit alcohol dehydrogenase family)
LARGEQRLDAACREAKAKGARAIAVPTDVADAAGIERAANRVEGEFGPIDIWINNAMTSVFAPVIEITPEEFKRATEVTYLGVVYGTMEALKRMLPRNSGTIIQIGSALAYRSIPLQSAYCGAKHAIVGFTDSLRCELIHERSNVRLTIVHLPALNTPQFDWVRSRLAHKVRPVPPIYQPEIAAEAIIWAADHPRREVWVEGSTYQAILGQKIFTGLLDLLLGRNGYKSQQQQNEAKDPNRPDNLWNSVPGSQGAHGSFDEQAHRQSLALWSVEHRAWLTLAVAIFGGFVGGIASRLKQPDRTGAPGRR